jgi:hypothetical protein
MIRPGEIDHLKCECFGTVVAHVSKGDRQGDPHKGDGLLTQDHSVEWVWAALELISGKSQSVEGVEVHEVEAAAPIHEGFGEPGHPDQQIDYEEKPSRHGDTVQGVYLSKVIGHSDQRMYSGAANLTALTALLVRLSLCQNSWGQVCVDQHDCLFFGERGDCLSQ